VHAKTHAPDMSFLSLGVIPNILRQLERAEDTVRNSASFSRTDSDTHISYTTCSSMNLFYHSFRYLCCYKICLAGCFHMINSGKIPAEVSTGQDISNTITRQTRVLFSFLGPVDTIRNSAPLPRTEDPDFIYYLL